MSYKTYKPSHLELINQKGREPIQPPRLLDHIKKTTISNCEQLLAHLFSATDDLFYDLSKRASSNNEQNLYFEAMREIRVKREGIANQFLRDIADSFSKLLGRSFEHHFDEDHEPANLSIVEGDDLEVDLAKANMVGRARDLFYAELNELTLRLDHLLLQVEIDEDGNPVDPQQLAEAFIAACQVKLQIDIKAKLILYKLFEKHVLKQLGHLYADANQILLDAGILPKIPKSMEKKAVHGGAPHSVNRGSDAGFGHPQGGEATVNASVQQPPAQEFRMGFDALSLIMAAARNLAFGPPSQSGAPAYGAPMTGAPQNPQGHQAYGESHGTYSYTLPTGYNCLVFSANPGPVMASPELTSLLTQTQAQYDSQLTGATPRNIVAEAVAQLLAEKDPQSPQALEQRDEYVINLVAMFFDEILSDKSLPVAVQSLISRMQIPTLKVALRDQSFFNNPNHPARELINTVTRVGISFDESKPIEKDPIYRKIAEVVQLLNRQYKTDDRIFTELKSDLEDMVERESRKTAMVEQRTTQSEEGKSKIKQARAAAQQLLYQKLKDIELPQEVTDFLTRHWLQVLVFSYLKHGLDSNEWINHEQTITDLIWVSSPHDDARSISRRERLFPELMDRLEFALECAIDDASSRRSTVNELEDALNALFKPTPKAAQPAPSPFEHFDDFARPTAAEPPPNEPATPLLVPLSEEHKEALGKGENAPKSWDEMTAVERQQARYEELSTHYFETAKNMPTGSWFVYYEPETSKTLRCKLASKIDAETYVFVNRMGFKVLDKTRKQFALDMQFGRATPLDTTPAFDRMMSKVVSGLSASSDKTDNEMAD